jgi:hypothetical protein
MSDTADLLDPVEAEASTALVVIPPATMPTILAADGASDILAKLISELAGFKGDVTTEKGRKAIASTARKAAVAKMDLVRLADGLKEGAQATIRAVNSEIKVVTERMDALRNKIRKPLDEFEEQEEARVTAHRNAVTEIEGWGAVPGDWTSVQIAARLAELADHPHRAREWQEFKDRAQTAARNSFNALKVALSEAEQREAAEAERQRLLAEEAERQRQEAERLQAEREAQIAAQAAAAAKAAAERKAAEEAAEVERKAQEERDAAAKRERDAAEALAQADRVAAEAAAEAERVAQAERDAADQRERAAAEALAQAERERVAAEEREQQARERAEEMRRGSLVIAMEAIRESSTYGIYESAAEIDRRLHYLRNMPARDWEEYAEQAAAVIAAEISRTEALLAAAQQREAEAAEAARVAAEQQAERDRLAAQRREEAAAAAAAEAERRRQQQEAAEAAEQARRREANIAHRRKINGEALAPLVLVHGLTEEQAKRVISAIAKGEVPHVKITY